MIVRLPVSFCLALAVLLAGCGERDTVVVGSKNFTEQRVLGEVLAQTVERVGLRADRRFDLGGTFVCDSAIRAGQIDTYVEYTGTALGAVLKQPADTDPARVLERVRAAYASAGLVWTEPLGFDNTFAVVVRPDAGVRTLSEAVGPARTWRAAFGYEFQQRADGYPALTRTYGLEFADIRTMDLGLLYKALTERQADVVVGSATDGLIDVLKLVVLTDDRRAFPPYDAVPIVRQAALDRHPALRPALAALGNRLSASTMRKLNHAVDGEHRSPADVVREWLGPS